MKRPAGWGLAALCVVATSCGNAPRVEDSSVEVPDTLLAPGQEYYWRAEFDSARVVWRTALLRARAEADTAGMASLMSWIGLAAMQLGDYEESREQGEAALALRLVTGASQGELARSYNSLGLLSLREDRLDDARQLFQDARDAAAVAGEAGVEGAALANLGLVQAYLGDLDAAAAMLREAQRAALETDDERLRANALTNLAMVSIWAGDPAAALAPLDTARALYAELEYPLGDQFALGQLATAHSAMGQFDAALAALDEALESARRHGMRDHEAENLRLRGGLYADLGDDRRALGDLEAAATLATELGYDAELGNILRRKALLRYSLGSVDRALAAALAAVETHRAAGYPFEAVDDLIVLADLYGRSGERAAADSTLRLAATLAAGIDARSARGAVALAQARQAERAGTPRQVLSAVARVRAEALEADFRTATESRILAARAYAGLALLDSAVIEGRAALNALDRVRGTLASDDLRGTFAAVSATVYGDVVLILLQLGHTEEAFAVADASRSRELLQRLTAVRASTRADGRPADPVVGSRELAEAELLLRRIDALLAQLREMESIPPLERGAGAAHTETDLVARIQHLREEYEEVSIRAARQHPRSAGMLGAVRTDALRVRGAVGEDEALLHYTLTAADVVVFVVRHDRFESLRIPVAAADMASRIRLMREIYSDRAAGRDVGLTVVRGLHEILIAPIIHAGLLDGAARLIIVPHGILEQLPFAALQNPGTGRFLVEDHFITYLQSANQLPAMRTEARRVAAVGAPSAFAPFATELPGTGAEAKEASRSAPRGRLHVNRRATESAVRRALTTSRVVHLASHGVLNARNPMFSRIELARGNGVSSADDGRLEVHEVLKMDVSSALVVLSGCETGVAEAWSGNPLRPAGVASLGQAFLHAGAGNVMATLWRIDDEGSAQLINHFYRHVGNGDVARALALAQRALIGGGGYDAPYYWAGFITMGDGRMAAGG